MTAFEADPPEDVPEELIAVLQNSSDSQLREIINYAQQLLRRHPPITDAVESRHGEELVRVEDHGATMIAVHVIEKASGAPDTASVEQREQRAAEIFSIITGEFDDSGVVLETDLRYGTDIASLIVGVAHDRSASAIVFTPRGGSRWRKLLTGDVTHNLVRSSDIPILVLPDRKETEIRCNQILSQNDKIHNQHDTCTSSSSEQATSAHR